MRRVILYALVGLLQGGCLSPGTIKPVATDNLQNVRNLRANNERLYEQYQKTVWAVGKLELYRRLQFVGQKVSDFATATGAADSGKLTGALNELKPLVEKNREIMPPEDYENFRRTLAAEKPVVGDVAAGFVSQRRVEEVIPVFAQTFKSSLENRTKVASAEPYLREYYLVKSWAQALDDTARALETFLAIVREQGGLAENHAQAILAFSDSKADFSDFARRLSGDLDVQTSIVKLVEQVTKDPQRKAAADDLLKTLGDILQRSSEPGLK